MTTCGHVFSAMVSPFKALLPLPSTKALKPVMALPSCACHCGAQRTGQAIGRGVLLHAGATVILQGTCHSLRAHNDHRNLLSGKTYRPHGSAVSRLSAHGTLRMG